MARNLAPAEAYDGTTAEPLSGLTYPSVAAEKSVDEAKCLYIYLQTAVRCDGCMRGCWWHVLVWCGADWKLGWQAG